MELTTLDIVLDRDNFEPGILDVLKHARPQWKGEDVRFKVFTEGITNKLLGCHLGDFKDVVLVRINGEKTDMIIDRDVEKRNMKLLEEHGCAERLYCAFGNGLCYGYVPGRTVDVETVKDDHVADLIAKEMVHFHAMKVPQLEDPDVKPEAFVTLRRWLKVVPTHFDDPDKNRRLKTEVPSREVLEAEISQMEKMAEDTKSPLVFCHNDLLLGNIVISEQNDRAHFIDFEYGGVNPEAYDIAVHFCEYVGLSNANYESYPDETFQKTWLRRFLEHKFQHNGREVAVAEKDVRALYVQVNKFVVVAHLFWGIWNLLQARYSTINRDFLGRAIFRLKQYFKWKKTNLSSEMPT